MSDDRPKPLRNDQAEGEEAFQLADKMLSERMIIASSLCIFVLLIVASQWEIVGDAIHDAVVWMLARLFG